MNNSILLIQNQNINSKSMGTGFVVHCDDGGSYILTCYHVLKAVKEPKIDEYEIEIVVQHEINFDKNNKHTRRITECNEFTDTQWEVVQKLASTLNQRGERTTGESAKFGRLLKLSKSKKKEEQQVELVHEALIRSWDTYKTWINEVRFFKQEHDVVKETKWQKN